MLYYILLEIFRHAVYFLMLNAGLQQTGMMLYESTTAVVETKF